jgi:hypothetical protein
MQSEQPAWKASCFLGAIMPNGKRYAVAGAPGGDSRTELASISRLPSLGLIARCRRGAFNPRGLGVLGCRSALLSRNMTSCHAAFTGGQQLSWLADARKAPARASIPVPETKCDHWDINAQTGSAVYYLACIRLPTSSTPEVDGRGRMGSAPVSHFRAFSTLSHTLHSVWSM